MWRRRPAVTSFKSMHAPSHSIHSMAPTMSAPARLPVCSRSFDPCWPGALGTGDARSSDASSADAEEVLMLLRLSPKKGPPRAPLGACASPTSGYRMPGSLAIFAGAQRATTRSKGAASVWRLCDVGARPPCMAAACDGLHTSEGGSGFNRLVVVRWRRRPGGRIAGRGARRRRGERCRWRGKGPER